MLDLSEVELSVDYELNRFEDYLQLMEQQFEDAALTDLAKMSEWVGEQYEYGYGEETDADVEHYEQHYRFYSDFHGAFPRYLRYSFVLLLYLIFEALLRRTCRLVLDWAGVRLKVPTRDFVQGCRAILVKHAQIASVDDAMWADLREFAQIRNFIIHSAGEISLSHVTAMQVAVERHNGRLSSGEFLIVETAYCIYMLKVVRNFYAGLFADLRQSFD